MSSGSAVASASAAAAVSELGPLLLRALELMYPLCAGGRASAVRDYIELLAREQYDVQRKTLKAMITVVSREVPEAACAAVDDVLMAERRLGVVPEVDSASLPVTATANDGRVAIVLWRGDITTLRVDAIVNAANCYMLGCFSPEHPCIDNAIHARAGPRLRNACRCMMGNDLEPTGSCRVTPAFALPCKHVLHTVGPIIDKGAPLQPVALRSSYRACLDSAQGLGLESVALCCVSAGVFGYPQRDAAQVAVAAVKEWLAEHPDTSVRRIVYDVFNDVDEAIYRTLIPATFS